MIHTPEKWHWSRYRATAGLDHRPGYLTTDKNKFKNNKQAMAEAYKSGHYTLKTIGKFFSVGKYTVSSAIHPLNL